MSQGLLHTHVEYTQSQIRLAATGSFLLNTEIASGAHLCYGLTSDKSKFRFSELC